MFRRSFLSHLTAAASLRGAIGLSVVMLLSAGACHATDFALRLQVIPLSNDDGSQPYNVTPDEFAGLIGRVNAVYAGTGIQFLFDADTDWAPMYNTALNTDGTDKNGVDFRTLGNQLAAKYPGKILCLLRWGPDPSYWTGNGYAYPPPGLHPKPPDAIVQDTLQNYVALPSLIGSFVGAYDYLNLLNGSFVGHELGHYLGLYHTFPGWGTHGDQLYLALNGLSAAAADQAIINYMAQHGLQSDLTTALDGDQVTDTPPDPSLSLYTAHGIAHPECNPKITVTGTMPPGTTVQGQTKSFTFDPDVDNIMGYYDSCAKNPPTPKHFSTLQIQEMIDTLTNPSSPRHALLSAAPECRQVTGCMGPSFWQFSLSCSGQSVGIVYPGNCTNASGESTPCYAGFSASTSVTASWSGAPGPPLFQTAASQETAKVCTANSTGNTCINVTPTNLPSCPTAPPSPPPACPTGEKLCDKSGTFQCVPANECLVIPATPLK
ncbi:MAG TPA: hypothetical protein VG096_20005 [Bryobacteraceae bacterium]|nr:hypothetical protein [Bryobacteraceae bacterium]